MSFVLLRESAVWKQIWVHVLHEREHPFDIAGKRFWMEYASHMYGDRLSVWKEITPRYRWIRIKVTLSIRLPRLLLTSKFTPFSPSSIAIFFIPLFHLANQKGPDSAKGWRNARPLALTDVCLLPVLLATAATVSAGLGSVFNQIKGAFPLLFSSIPGPATAPNPRSLDWYPLTMTFLHMRPGHDGAVGSNWLSADF